MRSNKSYIDVLVTYPLSVLTVKASPFACFSLLDLLVLRFLFPYKKIVRINGIRLMLNTTESIQQA